MTTTSATTTSADGTAAIVGAGTIGLAWAGLFAARGWDVQVFDPRLDLPDALKGAAATAAAVLGGDADDIGSRLHVADSLAAAVTDVRIVQEAGPERLDWKRDTFCQIERLTSDSTVMATSSSSIPGSSIAEDNLEQGRLLVGHPFNPLLVLPLIEVVPTPDTRPEIVDTAVDIYASLGKEPVVLALEIRGFIGNRLQWALIKEATSLVADGVVTPADLDRVVKASLRPRWAAWGPLEATRLGGGPYGALGLLENVGTEMADVVMGDPSLDDMRKAARVIDDQPDSAKLDPATAATRLSAVLASLRERP